MSTFTNECGRRSSGRSALERRLHSPEFEACLLELRFGNRGVHYPVAGPQPGARSAHVRAAKGDAELTVPIGVGPSDRPRVTPAIDLLEIANDFERGVARRTAHCRRRVH